MEQDFRAMCLNGFSKKINPEVEPFTIYYISNRRVTHFESIYSPPKFTVRTEVYTSFPRAF